VRATLDKNTDADDEKLIVTRFSELMARSTADEGRDLIRAAVSRLPAKRQRRLLDSALHQLVDVFGNDVQLVDLVQRNSTDITLVCRTTAALSSLRRMYLSSARQLHRIIEDLFTSLLDDGRSVRLDRLDWSETDYNACLHRMHVLTGLIPIGVITARRSETEPVVKGVPGTVAHVQGGPTKMAQFMLNPLTLSNINRFSKFFHCFVIILSLKIPLHLKCVATLPCKMSVS